MPNSASVPKAAMRNVSSEENRSLQQRREQAGFGNPLLKAFPIEYRVHFTHSITSNIN